MECVSGISVPQFDRKINETKAHLDRMQHMQDHNETLDDSGSDLLTLNTYRNTL